MSTVDRKRGYMTNLRTFISKKHIAMALLIVAAFIVFEMILQATLYNPVVMVPVLRYAYAHHIFQPLLSLESNSAPYPLLRISNINSAKYFGPRASVIGVITDVQKSFDGDWHLNITAKDGAVLVGEIIPEYQMAIPAVGDKVRIWGVVRYDMEHRWWELHPVIGWSRINS